MKPTLKQLEYFLAIVKHGSIRRAAEELEISQPTLTAQLAKLEKVFKLNLFERARSGTVLSPAGKHMLPYIQVMIEDMNNLLDAAEIATNGSKANYRLGVAPTLGPYLLAYLLPLIHEQYQQLKFYVREDVPSKLKDGLLDGLYDLLLIPLPLFHESFHIELLIREELFLVMADDHPLAGKSEITKDNLVGEKVITLEENHIYAKQVEQLCEKFGCILLRDYQGNSLDALRAMISTGVGIAFLPSLYVHSEIKPDSNLFVSRIKDEPIHRMHAMVWRHSSPARMFFKEFATVFKKLIQSRLGDVVEKI